MNTFPNLSPGMLVELRSGERGSILSVTTWFNSARIVVMFNDRTQEFAMPSAVIRRIFDEENETVWEAAA